MSKHNTRFPSEVENYLKDRGLDYKIRSQEFAELKYCPICPKHHNEDFSNLYKFHINTKTGWYQCFRGSCNAKGSWLDFKNLLNGNLQLQFQPTENLKINKMESLEFHPFLENVKREKGSAYQYISGRDYTQGQRGIDRKILLQYQVGVGTEIFQDSVNSIDVESVFFPMYRRRTNQEVEKLRKARLVESAQKHLTEEVKTNLDSEINNDRYELVKCKIRGGTRENKHLQKVIPSQAMDGIFGLNTVPENTEEIIITEGEFDAMAAYQVTGIPSISLPFGAKNLPDYLVKWIDQFTELKKIYLWLDEDEAGRLNAPKMAKKLGFQRCVTVRTSYHHKDSSYPKDANDALRECPENIQIYLKNAKSEIAQNIIQFADLKQTIYQRFLRSDESHGITSTTLPIYNKTTKGLRNGELSIITGPTGSGKTTFLSQLSLDLCEKGVNTLWGSFEIKNERFLESMMLQYAKCDLTQVAKEEPDKFNYVCQKFEEVPLYLMNFYGSTNIHSIMDTIEYAIHMFQVSHVCLDNLQFMLGNQEKGFKKFDFQDEVIEKFRRIATDHDIHLTLVIHPKKVDEAEDLNIASVFGTAKATQEADNVYIIQNRGVVRVFDVKKNRYDGDTGRAPLGFDKKLKLYFQLTQNQAIAVEENRMTIAQIIEDRQKQNGHFQSILQGYKPLTNGGGGTNNGSGGPSDDGSSNKDSIPTNQTNIKETPIEQNSEAKNETKPSKLNVDNPPEIKSPEIKSYKKSVIQPKEIKTPTAQAIPIQENDQKQSKEEGVELKSREKGNLSKSKDLQTHLNYDEFAELSQAALQEFGLDQGFFTPKKVYGKSYPKTKQSFSDEQNDKTNQTFQKSRRIIKKSLDVAEPILIIKKVDDQNNQKSYELIKQEDGALEYDKKFQVKLLEEELVSFYSNNQPMELPNNIKGNIRK